MTSDLGDAHARLSHRFVLATTLASIAIAVGLLQTGQQGVMYDARGYYDLATLIAHNGVFGYASSDTAATGIFPTLLQVKPNGYPLFLAAVGLFSTFEVERLHQVVFGVQLAIYLFVCRFAAARLGRIFHSPSMELGIYIVSALNPFLLIQTTEMLSDSLSASLVCLAVVLALPLPERASSRRALLFSFVLASLATVVRSANVAVLAALVVIWLLRLAWFRDVRWRLAPAVALLTLLPFVPQVVNNYLAFGSTSPFVARNEYAGDLLSGARSLKYLTVVIPERRPQWIYANPFLPAGVTTINEFIEQQPGGYAITLGLHAFALLDQDYPFTYVTDLRPWYRWPSSLASFVFLGLGGWGLYLLLRRCSWSRDMVMVGAAVLIASGACLAVYLPPHVESRYAMPIFLLLTTPVVAAAFEAKRLIAAHRLTHLLTGASALAVSVALAALLSRWLQTLQLELP